MANFKDHFSDAAACYAEFRPTYPEALFAWLASLCNEHDAAWDCATGSGQVLAAHDPDAKVEPASLTKVMTAYLAFTALKEKRLALDQRPPVSAAAYKAIGSRMFVDPLRPATVEELLNGMIVQSGNDACVALAEAIAETSRLTPHRFGVNFHSFQPGAREIDVATDLEYRMRKCGADGPAFSSIVASGLNGAKPHAGAGEKGIEKGDLVTLDFGCAADGYCADITRTVAIAHATDRQRELYDIVLQGVKDLQS